MRRIYLASAKVRRTLNHQPRTKQRELRLANLLVAGRLRAPVFSYILWVPESQLTVVDLLLRHPREHGMIQPWRCG